LRCVIGIQAGLAKAFKINTYGLTRKQVEYVAWAFKDIARKYDII
jgi:Sep-tRNA:Cys-tRNA synthetase